MPKQWTGEEVAAASQGFQAAAVVHAAAELDVFGALSAEAATAEELAERIDGDVRATRVLADALTAMELLVKRDGRYSLADGVADVLTADGTASELAMVRHRANCYRSWGQLARIVRTGEPARREPSVLGEEGDLVSFIEAMEVVSRRAAPALVEAIGPLPFRHLLDVGGGPATWTIAFLRAAPEATATLYDREGVVPIAEKHLAAAGLLDRVRLVAGDFYADAALPTGADLAWVSAIIHQNSREQNRALFAKAHAALDAGGRVLVRDVVMDESRTDPPGGAMFAVNMLVHTQGGGTFTFQEIADDLAAAGFADAKLLRRDEWMGSVVQATKA